MAKRPKTPPGPYGLMAEFLDDQSLLAAAERTYSAGYREMDAYSPFPVEGLDEAIGFHQSRLPQLVLLGGILGAIGGFFMQWYANVVDYPFNIGGRPLNSWPAYMPVTFETTILTAVIFCVFGMLALNGLPQPYHPVFNVTRFRMATRDRFFLCIQARDPKFNLDSTQQFLESLQPMTVSVVEP